MFEARLVQGSTIKKMIEAIRELVIDANVDCSPTGISLQVIKITHATTQLLVSSFCLIVFVL